MPMEALVGSRPTSVVATPIRMRVKMSTVRRPTLSPTRPIAMAPAGRKKKLTPMVARDASCAQSPRPLKNSLANSNAATLA